MQRLLLLVSLTFFAAQTNGAGLAPSKSRFYYRRPWERIDSALIIRNYWGKRIVHPFAKVDPRIDPKLRRAATIAQERANAKSKQLCWRYLKEALLAAGAVGSYPKTVYATQAGDELMQSYGFQKLPVKDPYSAPLGAILVYGGRGHVEIRTKDGFASDYHSKNRCFYPLIAAYGKFSP